VKASVVAVVINWKDATRTIKCVSELRIADADMAIVVVDNESSGEFARQIANTDLGSSITLIPVPLNKGFAGGMNEAFLHIKNWDYQFVLAINNDAAVDKSALAGLLDCMTRDSTLGIVAPRVVNSDGSLQSAGATVIPWRAGIKHSVTPESIDYLTWACVLLRRSMLDEVGMLDERFFMYWEDVDYGIRARAAGWKLAIDSTSSATHELSASRSKAGNALTTYYVWGLGVMAAKWGGPWWGGAVIRALGILAKRIVRLDFHGAAAVAAGIFRWSSRAPRAYLAVEDRPVTT